MRFGVRWESARLACQRPAFVRNHAAVAVALTLAGCGHFPQSADARAKAPTLRVADAALATGAPEVALNVAQVILQKDPHNVKALIAQGDAYYALRQRPQAEASYRTAIEADPSAASAQVGIGRILVRTDPAAAEAAFQSALKSDPTNVDALNNLGVARDLAGRYSEAEDAYYHALMSAPDSVDVQINLGVSLALSGHNETALRLLRGVASDENAVQAWHNELSHALMVAGDPGLAQRLADANPAPATGAPVPTIVAAAAPPAAPPAKVAQPVQVAAATPVAAPDESAMIPADSLRPAPLDPVLKLELSGAVASAPVAITMPVEHLPKISDVPASRHSAPVAKIAAKATVVEDAKASEPAPLPSSSGDASFVQLGSLNSEADARFEWLRLAKLSSGMLAGHDPTVTQAEVHGRTYWRLRTFGFASTGDAADLCAQLKSMAQRCWPGRGL